jgi:hypothetical protein
MCQQSGNFENISDLKTALPSATGADFDVHLINFGFEHWLIGRIIANANAITVFQAQPAFDPAQARTFVPGHSRVYLHRIPGRPHTEQAVIRSQGLAYRANQ